MEIFFETLIVGLILFNLGLTYKNVRCIARIESWKNQIIAAVVKVDKQTQDDKTRLKGLFDNG